MVSLVWSEPSAFITYISKLPSRCDTKAILPAPPATWVGVAVGVGVGVGVDGMGVGVAVAVGVGVAVGVAVGVGVMVGDELGYGDQAGAQSSSGSLVSLVTPEPSAFITYISALPSRAE